MLQWLRDDECGIALDTAHNPVVISTWLGRPSGDVVDRYYRWCDATAAAALAAEQQLVHIADLSGARQPAARVRKRIYEHAQDDLAAEVALLTIVVRGDMDPCGFVRSVGRLASARHATELVVVETVREAILVALARMWDARIPPPFGLDPVHYRTPRL